MENRSSSRGARKSIGQTALLIILLLVFRPTFSQEVKPPNGYLKVQGYVAVFHPIDGYNTPPNFKDSYVVGFPIGINIFKKEKIGYSFELFPFIQADSTGSKVSKIVFHPGVVFPLKHGFSFVARAAFESTGRYGVTQVFSKTIVKTKSGAFGAALVIAERFGNGLPTSVSYGIGIGLSF
jgi:hypothetical protein